MRSLHVTRRCSILPCVLVSAALATGAATPQVAQARAPEPEDVDKQARGVALYEDGTAKYDAGDYALAIESFKASFDLLGDPLLLYNLAVCYDRLERFDEALEYFTRYRAVAPAGEHAQIDRKIASAQARRDAASQADSTAPSEPPPSATGRADAPVSSPPSNDAAPRTDRVMTPAAWSLAGISVVALGVGVGLGVAASRRNRDGEAACIGATGGLLCDADGADDLDAGRRFGIGSITAFAIGGALAVAAVAVIATNAGRKRRSSAAQARLVPSGLGLAGRF